MRQFLTFISLLTLPFVHNAQTLKGKVYDETTFLKNIKVFNKTQNRFTITNKNGSFKIEAKVNDTLSFESLFYHPKVVILKKTILKIFQFSS